jgi:predicted transposase/invertase (TIGR01784 family)
MNQKSINAKGPLSIKLTNDYLFRALLQRNNNVLKGLLSSLLHLPMNEMHSVSITNPIVLGEAIDDKTFILDIKVLLNNHTIINLEMQVINEQNWPERSLSYLCRAFDNLNAGADYIDVKPAVQIGLLDFTLFPDYPEFFAEYKFLNVKNHSVYSDKLQLFVLDLTRIDLATTRDKYYCIDHWARLFQATTWEEIMTLSENDELIHEATDTIYQLTQDEMIRQQCEAREDYYRRQRSVQKLLNRQKQTLKDNEVLIRQQENAIKQKDESIKQKEDALKQKEDTLKQKEDALKQKDDALKQKDDALKQKEDQIRELTSQLQALRGSEE